MKPFGLLIVVLITFIGIEANSSGFRARIPGPDEDIDWLAVHKYADRLRQERQWRKTQLARAKLQQHQPEAEVLNADSQQNDLKMDVLEKRGDPPPPSPPSPPASDSVLPKAQVQQEAREKPLHPNTSLSNIIFIAVVAGCSVAGFVGLVVAGVCWYRLQKNVKAASEAEYPAYGITGPTKDHVQSPGDRKLAQSAQMYHYQHQKQQMIALEKANSEMKQDGSDEDSDEENEEGDYTVYECPGLAPTGEMEVKNPLFSEDTPVTPTMPANK